MNIYFRIKKNQFYLIGSIVRCMRRLEELLRQMCCAAKAIGNSELEAKFTEGINTRFYLNKKKQNEYICFFYFIRYTKNQT